MYEATYTQKRLEKTPEIYLLILVEFLAHTGEDRRRHSRK